MNTSITIDQLRKGLSEVATNPAAANDFFGKFHYLEQLLNGNSCAAFAEGIELLQQCQRIAPDAYAQVHKGTPFYWLGTAAFLKHDYEIAVFFFDAACSEDLRIGAHPIHNSTPSFRFILVEADQPAQAARSLVEATQKRLEQAIADYNCLPGRPSGVAPLQLKEVRDRFLRLAVLPGGGALRTLATAFISFCLEWDYMSALITLRPCEGTTEPFFLHLFKGCLLFESLLKANPKKPPPKSAKTLGTILQYLHSELGTAHDITIREVDFLTILASLQTAPNSIPIAIEYAGKIRNTVGHHLGLASSSRTQNLRLSCE